MILGGVQSFQCTWNHWQRQLDCIGGFGVASRLSDILLMSVTSHISTSPADPSPWLGSRQSGSLGPLDRTDPHAGSLGLDRLGL